MAVDLKNIPLLTELPAPPDRRRDTQTEFDSKVKVSLDAQKAMVAEMNDQVIPAWNSVSGVINEQLPYIQTVANADTQIRINADNIAQINTSAGHMEQILAVNARLPEIQTTVDNLPQIQTVAGSDTEIRANAEHMEQILAVNARLPEIQTTVDNLPQIQTVAGSDTEIRANAEHMEQLLAVHVHLPEIQTTVDNLPAITSAPTYAQQARDEADRAKAEADRAKDIVGLGPATTSALGLVKPDDATIKVSEDGTISIAVNPPTPATNETIGLVKPDNITINVSPDGTLSVNADKLTARYA